MISDGRPAYAYVPGQTPRHADGMFDHLKTGLRDIPAHRLHETKAWATGLAFLREGYFWEAHEVLEAVWMVCPQNSAERLMVQAIIQRANAGLKQKMGKENAAARLFDLSDTLYREAIDRAGRAVLGLALGACIKMHNITDTAIN